MTAASEAVDRAKRFRVFRNGDPRFYGKEFVLNKRRIRTWESFLQQVTNDVKFTEAVRSIRTPVGGTKVKSLDDLQDSKHYVAVGNSRFNKNIRYLELEDLSRRNNHATSPRFLEVKPVEHSRIQVSGKIRKIPTDVLTIFVYSNGNELQQAKRVTLTRPMLQRWDAILEEVTNKVGNLTTCLYTLDGTKITNPASLQKGNFYVAVDKRFKKLDYGAQRPGFNTSPKQRRKLMPIVAPHRRGRKLRTGSDQLGRATMDNSVASSESEKSPKSYISTASNPLHNRPPPNRRPLPRKKLEKKEDESVFHAKPVKHRRSNDKVEEIDYDKDEGGVFKAKGSRLETDNAEVVQETKDTKVDLPIDQVEAEEVEEEIEVDVKKGKKKAKKAASPTPRSPTPERQNSISEQPHSPTLTKTPTPPIKSRPKRTPRKSSPKETSYKSQSNHTTPRISPSQDNGEHDPQSENGQLSDDANKENEAASKIQANYRGYRTRKSLSKGEKEEKAELNGGLHEQDINESTDNDHADSKDSMDAEESQKEEERNKAESPERVVTPQEDAEGNESLQSNNVGEFTNEDSGDREEAAYDRQEDKNDEDRLSSEQIDDNYEQQANDVTSDKHDDEETSQKIDTKRDEASDNQDDKQEAEIEANEQPDNTQEPVNDEQKDKDEDENEVV